MEATSKVLKIREELKGELDALKIHRRETYDDVISRLVEAERKRQEGEKGDE